jgi:hypothetical protein
MATSWLPSRYATAISSDFALMCVAAFFAGRLCAKLRDMYPPCAPGCSTIYFRLQQCQAARDHISGTWCRLAAHAHNVSCIYNGCVERVVAQMGVCSECLLDLNHAY